jgi:flagellar export protein FliJ
MTADARGFSYELDPLRRKRQWELELAVTALQQANARAHSARTALEAWEIRFAAARVEWVRRIARDASLDAASHHRASAYLADLMRRIDEARLGVENADGERDLCLEHVAQAHRAMEAIERHRKDALEQFRRDAIRAAYAEADDQWLRRIGGLA